jgi:hypothetical protein
VYILRTGWLKEAGLQPATEAISMAKRHEVKIDIASRSRVSIEGEARLVRIFQSDLGDAEANEVAALLPDLTSDTPKAESAALRLKPILLKLGKVGYDLAIKIISDVASETVKKSLGL